MSSKDIISSGILEQYVLGLTNEQETAQVEQYAVQYSDVATELRAIEDAMEQVALANAIAPSDESNTRFNTFLQQQNTASTTNDASTIQSNDDHKVVPMHTQYNKQNYKWLAAASVVLLVSSLVGNYLQYSKLTQANDTLATVQKTLDDKNKTELVLQKNVEVAFSNYSQPIVLKGLPKSPESQAKIYWMKNTGEVYIEPSGLPTVPAGKQYQLWAIVDGKPQDAGVIKYSTSNGTYQVQKMKSFGSAKVQAFAITLEKDGGNETPTTTEMYVMSTT